MCSNVVHFSPKALQYTMFLFAVWINSSNMWLQKRKAVITEAIQKGTISFTQTFTTDDTMRTLYKRQGLLLEKSSKPGGLFFRFDDVLVYDYDGNPTTTYDQIRATGTLDLGLTGSFNMSIDDWELKHLEVATRVQEDIDLRMKINIVGIQTNVKHEIYRGYLHPVVVFVGFVPVVFTPILTVNLA